MEEICRIVETETGKKAIIRYQMDKAGPHTDEVLVEFLEAKFESGQWMLKFQPSNLPICNVKDDCIFPAMSKHVSQEQGISKGSQVHTLEELWAAVTKCWNEFLLDTIARAYVLHSKIANAIATCDGGDSFDWNNKMHCNVCNSCFTANDRDGNPSGVEVAQVHVELDDEDNKELTTRNNQ